MIKKQLNGKSKKGLFVTVLKILGFSGLAVGAVF